jgi:hypothetical protein
MSVDDLPYIEFKKGGKFKRLYADVWKSEQISATATITEHAVEKGSKITDHILPDQLAAKATLFISGSPIRGDLDKDYSAKFTSVPIQRPPYPNNTPLISPGGLTQAATGAVSKGLAALGLGGTDGPPDKATVLVFKQDPAKRLYEVYEQLLELRTKSELVNVGFSVGRVENLAISSIVIARTSDDGNSGSIDLEFKQISFVSTQSTAAIPVPLEPRAKPRGDSVTVSAADATGAQKSTAKAGLDKARGIP